MAEYCIPPARAKSRRRRGTVGMGGQIVSGTLPSVTSVNHQLAIDDDMKPSTTKSDAAVRQKIAHATDGAMLNLNQEKLSWIVIILLVALIGFNVILYVKLWKLDSYQIDGFKWETMR
jgi:hypothetical protein